MTATRYTLPRLHVGAGTTVGALTTFPLWVQAPSVRGLHWSGNELTIAEIAGSPSVDELTVTNRSQRPAVLLEGDLVEGGLQHRMVAASGLMAAGTTGMLAARCIEQGRWDGQQGHQATRRRAPYSVYAAERDHVGAADQGDVWRRINRFEQRLGRTPSASMVDHLARRPAPQHATRGGAARRDHRDRRSRGRGRDLRTIAWPGEPLGGNRGCGLAGCPQRADAGDAGRTGARPGPTDQSGQPPDDQRRRTRPSDQRPGRTACPAWADDGRLDRGEPEPCSPVRDRLEPPVRAGRLRNLAGKMRR